MAHAMETALGDHITAGHVVTKYDHYDQKAPLKVITVTEAAHPVPDDKG